MRITKFILTGGEVNWKVIVTVEKPIIAANATDNVTLLCNYSTSAEMIKSKTIVWTKILHGNQIQRVGELHENGIYEIAELYSGRAELIPPANLVLYDVSRNDSGVFKCAVHLLIGVSPCGADKDVTLTINGKGLYNQGFI